MDEHILVVEDNKDLAYLLEYILKREGFEVMQINDGRSAEECVAHEAPPRAVVLDLMLPHADGFDVLNSIRNSATWGRVPVLMLSARSQEEDIVRALDNGANDYLSKPFQPQEMLARLRRIMPRAAQ